MGFWIFSICISFMIPLFFVIGKPDDTVGILMAVIVVIQLIIMLISIVPTERALKKTFDQNGLRIDKGTDKKR